MKELHKTHIEEEKQRPEVDKEVRDKLEELQNIHTSKNTLTGVIIKRLKMRSQAKK